LQRLRSNSTNVKENAGQSRNSGWRPLLFKRRDGFPSKPRRPARAFDFGESRRALDDITARSLVVLYRAFRNRERTSPHCENSALAPHRREDLKIRVVSQFEFQQGGKRSFDQAA
jgi:hypothetical protein